MNTQFPTHAGSAPKPAALTIHSLGALCELVAEAKDETQVRLSHGQWKLKLGPSSASYAYAGCIIKTHLVDSSLAWERAGQFKTTAPRSSEREHVVLLPKRAGD